MIIDLPDDNAMGLVDHQDHGLTRLQDHRSLDRGITELLFNRVMMSLVTW